MSRLTYKLNKQEQEEHKTKYLKFEYLPIQDYCIEKGNFGRITNDMIYNKLGKLEDLEEELGCPLEVVFKSLKNGIYLEERKSISTEICYHALECEFVIEWYKNKEDYGYELLKDYKKTWWLKEDKSE